MTKKDLFITLIKVFGLLSLVTSLFSVIPNNIIFAMGTPDTTSVLWIGVSVIFIGGLFVVLVFKADRVVDLLKLDKGFQEDRIEIGNLKSTDIIKIGTFMIGGFMIIDNVPGFLSNAFWLFKKGSLGPEFNVRDKFTWGITGLNILIGYLLVTNYEFIARLFKSKSDVR